MKLRCTTKFDITATGVTGHCKPSRMPFFDQSGQRIANEQQWNHARNQQRNWETITQLISLRTQVDNLSTPVHDNGSWTFEFEVEQHELFLLDSDPVGILKQDCENVPMLIGLKEKEIADATLNSKNIWFELINIS